MTQAFEARGARRAFIGGQENEMVFTRGATEAINLVAQRLPKEGRPRVAVAARASFEHRAVAARRVANRRLPADPDGQIDLDAAEAMMSESIVVAFAHVSNVLGSILDAKRAPRWRTRSARSCCSTAARRCRACRSMSRRSVAISTFSPAHKLYGPTGIGALWGRAEMLDAMPPWQGGGAMIDRVTFAEPLLAPPARFEAGTPQIVGAVGLHAAIDYVAAIGLDAIHAHEAALVAKRRDALRA